MAETLTFRLFSLAHTEGYFCGGVKIQVFSDFQIFTIFTPLGGQPSLQTAAGPPRGPPVQTVRQGEVIRRVKRSKVRRRALGKTQVLQSTLVARGHAGRVERA